MVNSKPNIMPPATASAKQESSSGEASQAKVVSEGRASAVPQVIVNVPNPQLKDGPAEILNAVAAVLWPLVIALVVIMFREQIISLARRVRNAKAFGAEAEFEKELEALNREANKAKEEAGVNQGPQQPEVAADAESSVSDDVRSSVLAEAARVPRLGLMLLSAEVDKLARRTAASSGHHGRRSTRQLYT